MYKLSRTKKVSLDLQMFGVFFFQSWKKYFHKTEGKLTQACSSSSHKPQSNLQRAETAETQVPTLYFIQIFHKAKLDPQELIFLS